MSFPLCARFTSVTSSHSSTTTIPKVSNGLKSFGISSLPPPLSPHPLKGYDGRTNNNHKPLWKNLAVQLLQLLPSLKQLSLNLTGVDTSQVGFRHSTIHAISCHSTRILCPVLESRERPPHRMADQRAGFVGSHRVDTQVESLLAVRLSRAPVLQPFYMHGTRRLA
ncbi:hypothetical protein CPB85DRAFT_1333138 [Mucidula mucida]|nr:hypothetical protein CPB85DRAFT_1333138 [Mucidula mucida]